MQILDIVDEYDGANIRIGTTRGSSYIWCGTVSDMLPAELMEVWGEYKRYFDARIVKFEKRLANAKKQKSLFSSDSFLFQAMENDIKTIKASLKEVRDSRAKCTNILKREIVERYPSIYEPNTIIFIVEGKEAGRAWNLEEWEKLNDRETKAAN